MELEYVPPYYSKEITILDRSDKDHIKGVKGVVYILDECNLLIVDENGYEYEYNYDSSVYDYVNLIHNVKVGDTRYTSINDDENRNIKMFGCPLIDGGYMKEIFFLCVSNESYPPLYEKGDRIHTRIKNFEIEIQDNQKQIDYLMIETQKLHKVTTEWKEKYYNCVK